MLSKLLIDKTKPQAKTVRLSDGRGMYLEISPAGGKWWRFKYHFAGKEKLLSLGVYPDISLEDARDPNGRAYNRTAHLPERRKMMQDWADYLDGLREQK